MDDEFLNEKIMFLLLTYIILIPFYIHFMFIRNNMLSLKFTKILFFNYVVL